LKSFIKVPSSFDYFSTFKGYGKVFGISLPREEVEIMFNKIDTD
jgi:hypothetical protein